VLWVIITGGLLGILMMRVLTMQVVALVERWPKLIDGAYIIIAWVGIKLIWEWGHHQYYVVESPQSLRCTLEHCSVKIANHQHYIPEMPQWLGIGMVVVLFILAVLYARAYEQKQAVKAAEEEPERVEL
jgi:predicted tellurium resistance membrane protein TerC